MVQMPGFTGRWAVSNGTWVAYIKFVKGIDFGGWNKAIFILLQAFQN